MKRSQKLIALQNHWHFYKHEDIIHPRAIFLLLPSTDLISGGVMSVVSIYRALKELENTLGMHVFLSTHPQASHFGGYTKHNRDVTVYGFKFLLEQLLPQTTVLFHVPEPHVVQFCRGLEHPTLHQLKKDKQLTYDLNILNQNPDYFPEIDELLPWLAPLRTITQTTAHYAYNKPFRLADKTIPSSYLGTPPGIDVFENVPFHEKRNTIIVGHDDHPQKEAILATIRAAIPELEIIVVQNMSFEEYTEHQKYSKFGISFGEGMDAYFIRCILYGGIGFAVNNETFFTDDIRAFPTVFNSYQELGTRLVSLINELNAPQPYAALVKTTRAVVGRYYHNASYQKRITHIHSNWVAGNGCVATEEILGPS